jgi:UDPglucose 6-dehydrogenase
MTTPPVRLGFIGAGFVGGAMIRGFSNFFKCSVYDKRNEDGSLQQVAENSDVIFVCVPTPEAPDGSCDTSIVLEVLTDLHRVLDNAQLADIEVVVRSTVPPEWISSVSRGFDRFRLLFMPEFLTARCADLDFINSNRFIIGTADPEETEDYCLTKSVFRHRFPGTPIKIMTWEEAAMLKYAVNNFFVVKVSYFNEIYDMCVNSGIDPDRVIHEMLNDGRIGRSHYQVPGPDGKRGWGGACFPKDSAAYMVIAEKIVVDPIMVRAARRVNGKVRR